MNGYISRILFSSLTCLLIIFWLAGCASKKPKPPPDPPLQPDASTLPSSAPITANQPQDVKWTFEPKAITLNIYSNKNLNSYQDYQHSLMICIYQLNDQNKFLQINQTSDGLEKLLECNAFDPSAVGFQRLFIQPGQNQSVVMDRLEGAQHIGIVAGYADLSPANASKAYQIPIAQAKHGMMFRKKTMYWAGQLTLNIYLDTQSIQRIEGAADAQ